MAWTGYCSMLLDLATAGINFETDTFNVMLATNAYTADQDVHNRRDDVTPEATGGGSTGYTAGGVAINVTTALDTANNKLVVTIPQAQWTTGAGGTLVARSAVLYKVTGGASSTDPLICYSTEAGDQTASNGGTFTVAAGTLTLQL